jgi:hypothetical protein
MATGGLEGKLSTAPTLFPTTVERFRQLCRVHSQLRLFNSGRSFVDSIS